MKKPRLLLVDDDPLINESLAFALAGDYEVTRAHDRAGRWRACAKACCRTSP
jgi:two-component system nitrogen regulation response regulator GlnG